MATSGVSGTSGQSGAQSSTYTQYSGDKFEDLNLESFIKLLVTELQTQDPMEPMDNSKILEQVSQIRAIASNSKLTETLDGVKLGQSMATASSLIGKTITGLDEQSSKITGKVDRVTVANGVTSLHVGDKTVSLKNVGEILPEGKTSS